MKPKRVDRVCCGLSAIALFFSACQPGNGSPTAAQVPIPSHTPYRSVPTTVRMTPTSTQTLPAVTATATLQAPDAADGPDKIAYFREGRLEVLQLDDLTRKGVIAVNLPENVLPNSLYGIDWSSSGEALAFGAVITPSLESEVFVVNLAETRISSVGLGWYPTWIPGSNELVMVNSGELNKVDQDGILVASLATRQDWSWGNPIIVPASSEIIIAGMDNDDMSMRGQGPYDFWQVPLDGHSQIAKSEHGQGLWGRVPTNALISPDGAWLLYTSQDPYGCCAVIMQQVILSLQSGRSVRYEPDPEAVPTELAEAMVVHNGWHVGWLPDSEHFLVQRLFSYGELGMPLQDNVTECRLDIVDLSANVTESIPICTNTATVNTRGDLIASSIVAEDGNKVIVSDIAGNPILDVEGASGASLYP